MSLGRKAARQRARRKLQLHTQEHPELCVPLDRERFVHAFFRAVHAADNDALPTMKRAPVTIEGLGSVQILDDTAEKRGMIRFFDEFKKAFPRDEEFLSAGTRAAFLTFAGNGENEYSRYYIPAEEGSITMHISNAFMHAVAVCRFVKNATKPLSEEEVHELVATFDPEFARPS